MGSQQFNDLVRRLGEALRARDFEHRGSRFTRRNGSGNHQIVELQRSSKSKGSEVVFTINVGTFLGRLAAFFPARHDPPGVSDSHWSERLGFLLPGRKDRWWTVGPNTDVAELADALIEGLCGYALPALERYSVDEQLRDLWLSKQAPNLTELQRLLHLSVLLHDIGPSEELASVISELRAVSAGRPSAGVVARHLEKLEELRPN